MNENNEKKYCLNKGELTKQKGLQKCLYIAPSTNREAQFRCTIIAEHDGYVTAVAEDADVIFQDFAGSFYPISEIRIKI